MLARTRGSVLGWGTQKTGVGVGSTYPTTQTPDLCEEPTSMSMPIVNYIRQKSQAPAFAIPLQLNLAIYANDCCGLAWPAIGTLCHDLNRSERQIHSAMQQLRQSGRVRVFMGAGPKGTNIYQLCDEAGEPLAKPVDEQTHQRGCPWRTVQTLTTHHRVQNTSNHRVQVLLPKNNRKQEKKAETFSLSFEWKTYSSEISPDARRRFGLKDDTP